RWVKYASPVLRLRVLVRRMNMRGEYRAIPGQATEKDILWHYISCHSKIPGLSANSSCQIRRKPAGSSKSWRRWANGRLSRGRGRALLSFLLLLLGKHSLQARSLLFEGIGK